MAKPLIGFIGQGWIGKHYADDFKNRGYGVVRYGLEEAYAKNKNLIKDCEVVFIAVPTPTTSNGFDDSILRQVVKNVGDGKVAVIKSTIILGATKSIQKENPDIFVFHSPEFLTESRAAYDAAHPNRNIIGLPVMDDEHINKAKEVLAVLPKAPYELICQAEEAELIKYAGNCWFYFKVLYINLIYELAEKLGLNYDAVKEAMAADPRIGGSHLNPLHKSGTAGGQAEAALKTNDFHLEPIHKTGRGAGGHCFIKDFAAFSRVYEDTVNDELGTRVLEAIKEKNIDLLISSRKDLDLLAGVYGEDIIKKRKNN